MEWVNIVGLTFGLVGTLVAARGLIVTEDQAIYLGVGRWSGGDREQKLKLPAVKDRLRQSRNTTIGLALIALGFLLQLIAAWPG